MFPSQPELEIRHGAIGRPPAPVPGILHTLMSMSPEECYRRRQDPIDGQLAKSLARAIEEAGIRASQLVRRVGDDVLEGLLGEGPGYQDFAAAHVSLKMRRRSSRPSFGAGAAS